MKAAPSPPNEDPSPVVHQPNLWCVEGKHQIYRDAKMLNDKGVMIRTLTVEQRVLTWILHTVPSIHDIFTRHQLDWMVTRDGRYSEELVRYLYASYVATLTASLDRKSYPAK